MASVVYDRARRQHLVVLTLDPEEAENLADGLPSSDLAVREIYEAAETARRKDENHDRDT